MRLLPLILLLLAASCDSAPESPAPGKPQPSPAVIIEPLTPIPPNRPTHLAADPAGTLFWVQETDDQKQIVFSMSPGALPSTTRLTTTTILEALQQPQAAGSIQSLVIGADARLYFFFTGGVGRTTLAVVGRYSPVNSRVEILTDTAALARASRFGDSLALARGTLVQTASQTWLWLRHDIDSTLLTLDPSAQPASRLKRSFEKVLAGDAPLDMRSPSADLVPGPANSLLYLDRDRLTLWRIDQSGQASSAASLAQLPAAVSTPALDEQNRILLFAPDQPPAALTDLPLIPSTQTVRAFPALVLLNNAQPDFIQRPRFTAPPRINLATLAPPWIVRDRSAFILYNAPTGELLRLRITQQ